MVLTAALLLVGTVLVLMTLIEQPVRRLPLSSALIYLLIGWAGAALLTWSDGRAGLTPWLPSWSLLLRLTEWAVLLSLVAIGIKLRAPKSLRAWRAALLLAGPGMVLMVVLSAAAAVLLLGVPWPVALMIGAVLAPTDPVLASEVQVDHSGDRDAVRMTLTAEGALNDGTAFPAVMAALLLMGLHTAGGTAGWLEWFGVDLLWAVGGGTLLGMGLGRLIGAGLHAMQRRHGTVTYDELLFIGTVALVAGLAALIHVSAFMAAFAAGATLLHRSAADHELAVRMSAFGQRCERLVEVLMVLLIGATLSLVQWTLPIVAFGFVIALLIRPLTVLLTLMPGRASIAPAQRRLIAWFGVRGVGSLFYLAFVIEQGVSGEVASLTMSAVLVSIAVSILLHGVSATPLMERYRLRRRPRAA